jgi:hypothetical protein
MVLTGPDDLDPTLEQKGLPGYSRPHNCEIFLPDPSS